MLECVHVCAVSARVYAVIKVKLKRALCDKHARLELRNMISMNDLKIVCTFCVARMCLCLMLLYATRMNDPPFVILQSPGDDLIHNSCAVITRLVLFCVCVDVSSQFMVLVRNSNILFKYRGEYHDTYAMLFFITPMLSLFISMDVMSRVTTHCEAFTMALTSVFSCIATIGIHIIETSFDYNTRKDRYTVQVQPPTEIVIQ
jgi:hypothetical protein